MERGIEVARAVAARHGLDGPFRVVEKRGAVNHVVVVGSGVDRFVVRCALDPEPDDEYATEGWCSRRASEYGIRTPEVVADGVIDGIAYGVQRFVDGVGGDVLADPELWSVLGRAGFAINQIGPDPSAPDRLFTRFGRDLPGAWDAHLAYHVDQLDTHDPLLRDGVYSARRQRLLRDTVTALEDHPMRFGLSHGDLTTRNLLVPQDDDPVLIDWGSASFGPVPWTDLLVLERNARDDGHPSRAELAACADALGVDLTEQRDVFATLWQLHLIDLVRWATERRPDRLAGCLEDLVAELESTGSGGDDPP